MEKKADAKLHKMVAGGYKIMEKLGSGSFGEIFKGRHVTTGEEVAIKFVMVVPYPHRSLFFPSTGS